MFDSIIYDIFPIGQKINLSSLSDTIGQKSPYFTVIEVKHGGMGACVRIKSADGDCYALKVILPEKFTSENSMSRYLLELKKWRTYSMCDGVLDTICILEHENIPCIVSPWLDKGDLSYLMNMSERTVFYNTMYRIIGTLDWVYSNYKTIHRDLKPSNILIDDNYLPYIADWGLAKTIGTDDILSPTCCASQLSNLTQENSFIGTFLYASPEQLVGSQNIDFRSDIFALGIIMYKWETGVNPFEAKSNEETCRNIVNAKFEKLGGIFKSTKFGASKIINKCLCRLPSERYQSYTELMNDIEQLANNVPSFHKYRPSIRKYSDLERPKSIGERIDNGEIDGCFGKEMIENGVAFKPVIIERENYDEQITIACDVASLGDYAQAVKILNSIMPDPKLLHEFPIFHERWIINMAWCVRKQNKIDEAIEWMNKIRHAKTLSVGYYVNLSEFYIAKAQYENALNVCADGFECNYHDADLLGNATLASIGLKKYDEALNYASKRLKINPGLHSYYEYGLLLLNWADNFKETDFPTALKYYKSAMLYFRKALAINPKFYPANINLGITYFKLKRYKDSLEILYSIDKTESSAFWIAKNLIWAVGGKECLEHCNAIIKQIPDSLLLKRVRSECLVDEFVIGKMDEDGRPFIEDSSWKFFSDMVNNKHNREASDLRYYGKLLYWSAEYEKSIEFFRWAERNYPDEWTYNFYASNFLLSLGRYNEALQQAFTANKKAPWRETTYQLIAKCYGYLGDKSNEQFYDCKYNDKKAEKERLYESCKNI